MPKLFYFLLLPGQLSYIEDVICRQNEYENSLSVIFFLLTQFLHNVLFNHKEYK